MVWQADRTELDILIRAPDGQPARPWLSVVLDDHSRAVCGYMTFLGAPSAMNSALALRQAIWPKTVAGWPMCGIPDRLYVDHGSDFTSHQLTQISHDCADGTEEWWPARAVRWTEDAVLVVYESSPGEQESVRHLSLGIDPPFQSPARSVTKPSPETELADQIRWGTALARHPAGLTRHRPSAPQREHPFASRRV